MTDNSGSDMETLQRDLLGNTLDPGELSGEGLLACLDSAFTLLGGDDGYQEMIQTAVPGMEATFGIRVPKLRSLSKDLVKHCRGHRKQLLNLVEDVWRRPSREHKLVALFIAFYGKMPPEQGWALAQRLIPDIRNWEVCDQLCLSLTKPALSKDADLFDTLEEWIQAENFWRRRVALVTAAIIRKPAFDDGTARELDQRALQMCLLAINDPEPYIAKAVDWTIREILKRRYEPGRRWMFDRLDDELSKRARSTLRKASAKLTDADRKRFLREMG